MERYDMPNTPQHPQEPKNKKNDSVSTNGVKAGPQP